MDRLAHLRNRTFDLIVIGGGIAGSGIARDAALRGLSVALFEKNDYCSGTTARSTRLIHGGLRYLETLQFRLVRLDLAERETLLHIAKHLVRPLPFVVPLYSRSWAYRWKLRAGMTLYDLLGFDKSLPSHNRLSEAELAKSEPLLEKQGLQGGFRYFDAQVSSPERLVIENLIDAREHGAEVHNYAEVISALKNGPSVHGVRVRDLFSPAEIDANGRLVINAGGPWADQIAGRIGIRTKPRLRMTKGIHFICPPLCSQALVLFSRLDNRIFFVVPWLGRSLVGTTDTDYSDDPGGVRTQIDDVDYLLESIRPFIPSIRRDRILYSYAGIRALVPEEGAPSSIPRMHRIIDETQNGAPGVLSLIGGKITGYRAIAEQTVDMACALLHLRRECKTALVPLPGSQIRANRNPESLDEKIARHLFDVYGSRAEKVIDLAESNSRFRAHLAQDCPDIAAQVVYSMRKEQCLRATDFLMRRSLIGFSADQGLRALPAVIAVMAEELNWSRSRQEEEFDRHVQWINETKIDC